MALLLGTREGVYRVADVDAVLDDADAGAVDQLLDTGGKVYGLADAGDAWFAAATTGLYRSPDLESWTPLSLPREPEAVTAVAGSPDGDRLYAGTMPAELYVSDDGGETWATSTGFREIDSRDQWWNPDVTPHVRTLATHPDVPDRLVLGIDGGGAHVSDDRGETWDERRGGITSFVHHLVALSPDEYVAASDAGVFWTLDGGRWWDYLYGDETKHRYFRGVFGHGRTMYAGGARSHPPVWDSERGADAALYRIRLQSPPDERPAQRAIEVDRVSYPGQPREIVLSGTECDGELFAGTNDGRVLYRTGDGWETVTVLESRSQIRCLRSD